VTVDASGTYGSGGAAGWSDGDFTYDGVTNVFDLVSVDTAGGYGAGVYLPAAALGDVPAAAAVPEPAMTAAGLAIGLVALRTLARRRPA